MAMLLGLSSSAFATSSRENLYAVGPGGNDTMRVRIVWNSTDVDADSTYFYGASNPKVNYGAFIWAEMDGLAYPKESKTFTPSVPTIQLTNTLPNYSTTDAYVSRVEYSYTTYTVDYSSPVIAV